jgi:hypothetical protein
MLHNPPQPSSHNNGYQNLEICAYPVLKDRPRPFCPCWRPTHLPLTLLVSRAWLRCATLVALVAPLPVHIHAATTRPVPRRKQARGSPRGRSAPASRVPPPAAAPAATIPATSWLPRRLLLLLGWGVVLRPVGPSCCSCCCPWVAAIAAGGRARRRRAVAAPCCLCFGHLALLAVVPPCKVVVAAAGAHPVTWLAAWGRLQAPATPTPTHGWGTPTPTLYWLGSLAPAHTQHHRRLYVVEDSLMLLSTQHTCVHAGETDGTKCVKQAAALAKQ